MVNSVVVVFKHMLAILMMRRDKVHIYRMLMGHVIRLIVDVSLVKWLLVIVCFVMDHFMSRKRNLGMILSLKVPILVLIRVRFRAIDCMEDRMFMERNWCNIVRVVVFVVKCTMSVRLSPFCLFVVILRIIIVICFSEVRMRG